MTLAHAVAGAAQRLVAAGLEVEDSRRDAALLARWQLGWSHATWLTRQQDALPPGFAERFAVLIARRSQREPVAYITGEREFYGRPFIVTRDVLIPRPESELLIDEVLARLPPPPPAGARPSSPAARPTSVVDVGTGSGCLAVTLALERPDIHVAATDVSRPALAIAARNIERYEVGERVVLRDGSLIGVISEPMDLVVANPPYVAERDRASLDPEVGAHEPPIALFGGRDGLDVMRDLVRVAGRIVSRGGCLILEIGAGQSAAVAEIIAAVPAMELLAIKPDLQGIPRVVVARRRP